MAKTVLGYWDMRGFGEPIRYLLHYRGVPFEDRRYSTTDQSAWYESDKFALGLDFPNLPYLLDGDRVRMTQSTAILRYLARKHDLVGSNDQETARADLVEQQLLDFRDRLNSLAYSPGFGSLKADFVREVPAHMEAFSAFLGDRKYLVGDRITYVDFLAHDTFDFYRLLVPGVLDGFQNLQSFQARIEELPAIREYTKSPVCRRWPIFRPQASWGGSGDPPKRGE